MPRRWSLLLFAVVLAGVTTTSSVAQGRRVGVVRAVRAWRQVIAADTFAPHMRRRALWSRPVLRQLWRLSRCQALDVAPRAARVRGVGGDGVEHTLGLGVVPPGLRGMGNKTIPERRAVILTRRKPGEHAIATGLPTSGAPPRVWLAR
jgi:hypothetical protein